MQTKNSLISAAEQLEQAAKANADAGLISLANGQFEAAAKLREQAAQMPDEPAPFIYHSQMQQDIIMEAILRSPI